MINLNALQRVLPISGLEPQWVAIIDGFSDKPKKDSWQESIKFVEPPAGQHIPYVDACSAIALLFKHQGMPAEDVKVKADEEWADLKEQLDLTQRVVFYDYLERNPGEHIPVPALLLHLRQRKLVSDHVADFLDRSVATVVDAPIFQGPDNWDAPWSIATLPDEPPAKAMIEFVPGPPWVEDDDYGARFDAWRDSMRVVADHLEKVLGESVYYFKVPDCDTDDDNVHRFLVLHWLCTCWPESTYVKFLVASSGAEDVEELKAALIHPDNYTQPFKMNDAFIGIDLPIQMEIDEEGRIAVLTVLRTENPSRVLLRVTRNYDNEILLEGVVDRATLASALKSEVRRFFTSEFDPQHWYMGRDEDLEEGYVQTRDQVLGHAWLELDK